MKTRKPKHRPSVLRAPGRRGILTAGAPFSSTWIWVAVPWPPCRIFIALQTPSFQALCTHVTEGESQPTEPLPQPCSIYHMKLPRLAGSRPQPSSGLWTFLRASTAEFCSSLPSSFPSQQKHRIWILSPKANELFLQ